MKDILLEKAFTEQERWENAIEKGVGKGISKMEMRELCDTEMRISMYRAIRDGKYRIAPPHTALIPKDTPGEFRTVYINEPKDRVLLSLVNDLLFDMCPEMVHENCMSYQRGKSCGKTVEQIARLSGRNDKNVVVGFKADLSKYFDSVPICFIDEAFDAVERKHGKSKLIDVVRAYYHQNYYFDTDGNLCEQYQSLKQGCAVASWLADVVLYDIDVRMSNLNVMYRRYSDDIVAIGEEYEQAMDVLVEGLSAKSIRLNPKKVEYIDGTHWFKFLGFSIRGNEISLSKNAIKRFQNEIERVTIKRKKCTYKQALAGVYRVLYKGFDGYSWASRVLRTINNEHDINVLDGFVKDCLRAVQTGKCKLGGLGWRKEQKDGCIHRGTGQNVKANKEKISTLEGYYTIRCMRNNLLTSRGVFDTIVRKEM